MSLKKHVLAVAVVSGLYATGAHAQVVLTNTSPTAVRYAEEIVASNAVPVPLADIAQNQIRAALSYNFSPGEVRYARVECSPNVRFGAGANLVSTNITGTTGDADLGAINGTGSNAIYFSVTADATNGVSGDAQFTIEGDISITAATDANCEYSLYDLPSQAQAGGTAGRIFTSGARLAFDFDRSYVVTVTDVGTSVADVETAAPNPTYGDFVDNIPSTATDPDRAPIGQVVFNVAATPTRLPNGTPITTDAELDDILGANSNIVVNASNSGFSAAASPGNTYDASARARVFITAPGATNCSAAASVATTLNANQATFNVGANLTVVPTSSNARLLCMVRRAGNTIVESDFTAGFNAVAASAAYAPTGFAASASGHIVRNGTQLQAPLAQVPGGWISRMVLTNTGSVARPYSIAVQGEAGNTISTNAANMTGTIPANGTVVVDLTTVLTGFTGAPRATLNVTVAGPDKQIQGLYQIVNPASGSISNHVMVRPGTN